MDPFRRSSVMKSENDSEDPNIWEAVRDDLGVHFGRAEQTQFTDGWAVDWEENRGFQGDSGFVA